MNPLYYYNGSLRWSLYWENPNCWAAFLVCMLPLLWAGQHSLSLEFKFKRLASANGLGAKHGGGSILLPCLGARCSHYFLYALELGVWFLLVKTYSRGGLVAAIVALVLFFGLRGTGCQPVGLGVARASSPCRSSGTSGSPVGLGAVGNTGWKPVLRSIIIRIALVAVLCLAAGFASRVSPSYIAQDKSVLNRLDMWQGALVMMKDSPWIGWGNNNGGFAYINWYQPQAISTRPIGFVNSFLDIGVEFGTPVLFVTLGIWFFLMLVAFRLKNPKSQNPKSQINSNIQISNSKNEPIRKEPRAFAVENGLMSAFVILVAWGVANIFTSLWRETSLWIVPAGCAVYILTVWWRQGGASLTGRGCLQTARRGATRLANESHLDAQNTEGAPSSRRAVWRPPLPVTQAFALSAGCVVVLLCAGWAFSGKYEWIARPSMGTDKITLIKRAKWGEHPAPHPVGASLATPSNEKQTSNQGVASDAPTIEHGSRMLPLLFIDSTVFGHYFGKTFRNIASTTTSERFEIYPPWTRNLEIFSPETKKVIITGFQSSWLARRDVLSSQEVVIFCPTVFPPIEAAPIGASHVSLYMPLASASEYNLAWRHWAQKNNIKIVTMPYGGLNIEPSGGKVLWRQLLDQ